MPTCTCIELESSKDELESSKDPEAADEWSSGGAVPRECGAADGGPPSSSGAAGGAS